MSDSKDTIVLIACAIAGILLAVILHLTPQVSAERPGYDTGILPVGQLPAVAVVQPKASSAVLGKSISRHYKTIDPQQAQHLVKLVYKHSGKQRIKPTLVLGLIGAESSFRSNALSPVGAVGYTQVWPKWHQDKIAGRDIRNTATNVEVGVKVLKECFKRRRTERGALACYNGATRVGDIDKYTTAVYRHMRRIESMLHL